MHKMHITYDICSNLLEDGDVEYTTSIPHENFFTQPFNFTKPLVEHLRLLFLFTIYIMVLTSCPARLSIVCSQFSVPHQPWRLGCLSFAQSAALPVKCPMPASTRNSGLGWELISYSFSKNLLLSVLL